VGKNPPGRTWLFRYGYYGRFGVQMKEKEVIARADHTCDACLGIIKKGEKCVYMEAKFPRYNPNDDDVFSKQVGIEYYRGWIHPYSMDCQETRGLKEGTE